MRAALMLGKLTGWGLAELRSLAWADLLEWLDEAGKLEREINASA